MKTFLALLLLSLTQPALAGVRTGITCDTASRISQTGQHKGTGRIFVALRDDGTATVIDRSDDEQFQILNEGFDRSGSAYVFRTRSTASGMGMMIPRSGVDLALNDQLVISIFSISRDQASTPVRTLCRVTTSSRLN